MLNEDQQHKFFDSIRNSLFAGKLSQNQVDGCMAIIDEFYRRQLTDLRWLAYILATTFHESAHTMMPVEEWGKGKNYDYGKKLKRGGGKGKRIPYDTPDKLFYGRGYVQITWYENYESMGKHLGVDLLNNPELALEPHTASQILFEGMLEGMFTGAKLSRFFNATTEDWVNARKIINWPDKAELVAVYGKKFMQALSA